MGARLGSRRGESMIAPLYAMHRRIDALPCARLADFKADFLLDALGLKLFWSNF